MKKSAVKRKAQIEIGGIDFEVFFEIKVEGGDREKIDPSDDEMQIKKMQLMGGQAMDLDFFASFEEVGGEGTLDDKVWEEVENDRDEEWEEE